MFGLDHTTLVRGGEAIVQGGGEIGQILFAAGAGIADLRAVQRSLEEEADKLFSSRGRNPTINQALSELEAARKQLREHELPTSQWLAHDKALGEAQRSKREVERELQVRQCERNRLER